MRMGRFALFIMALSSALALASGQSQPQMPMPPVDEYPAKLPSVSSSPSASSTSPTAAQKQVGAFVLGAIRIRPIYVDAGPLAAAEEHSYWSSKGPQFTVITAQIDWAGSGPYCGAAKISVRTDAETEHGPEQLSRPGSAIPAITGPTIWSWVFQTDPGEHPVALVFRKPALQAGDCYGTAEADWGKVGTDAIALPLQGLPPRDDIAEIPQHGAPARLGQLEISLTAVGLASKELLRFSTQPAQHDHHVVRLSLAIKNVSEHPNCTALNSYLIRLFDSRGYEYQASPFGAAEIGALLPGEGLGGNISFEIWNGSAPAFLSISRSIDLERYCAGPQHRPVDLHGGSRIRIPIERVPAVSQPSS
jgi:hypothetical protein